jgi:hypothetical protein
VHLLIAGTGALGALARRPVAQMPAALEKLAGSREGDEQS